MIPKIVLPLLDTEAPAHICIQKRIYLQDLCMLTVSHYRVVYVSNIRTLVNSKLALAPARVKKLKRWIQ